MPLARLCLVARESRRPFRVGASCGAGATHGHGRSAACGRAGARCRPRAGAFFYGGAV